MIQQNVSPQIEGLRLHEVPLDPARSRIAIVVTIPAAKGRAPHQAKDGRYYRRHNFSNQIMNDSEIRDTMRRATTLELFVALRLGNPMVQFDPQAEISKPVRLRALIGNRSPQPAFHANVLIGIDKDLVLGTSQSDFGLTGTPPGESQSGMNWLLRRLLSPPREPIFQEADPNLSSLALIFAVRSEHLRSTLFRLSTIIQTPGYSATEKWVMICEGGMLTLYDPGHPKTRTA